MPVMSFALHCAYLWTGSHVIKAVEGWPSRRSNCDLCIVGARRLRRSGAVRRIDRLKARQLLHALVNSVIPIRRLGISVLKAVRWPRFSIITSRSVRGPSSGGFGHGVRWTWFAIIDVGGYSLSLAVLEQRRWQIGFENRERGILACLDQEYRASIPPIYLPE